MLGTLTLFQHLLSRSKSENMDLFIPLMTDNQGNALSILNNNSKKWPASAVLMEMVTQAHIKGVALAPSHIKRSRNKWADALAGLDTSGFDEEKRVPAILDASWRILGKTTGLHYNPQGATSPADISE